MAIARETCFVVFLLISVVSALNEGRFAKESESVQSSSYVEPKSSDDNLDDRGGDDDARLQQRTFQSAVPTPTMCTGKIKIFMKSGEAVKYTTHSKSALVLSKTASEASEFLLVPCLALKKVDVALRPQCVSLMAANRQDWYVRHYGLILYLEPLSSGRNPHIFDVDSSFIVYQDHFYQNFFSFVSVNFPDYFISSTVSSQLKIVQHADSATYYSQASFALSGPPTGWVFLPSVGKYYRVIFEMIDWKTADKRCRELSPKSHLVVVDNATENQAIKDFLRSLDPKLSRICNRSPDVLKATFAGGFWTSGRRAEMSCGSTPWVWNPYPHVTAKMTFADFAPGEPNCSNVLNIQEHFAHFCTVDWLNLQWNDMPEGWPLCALCELD